MEHWIKRRADQASEISQSTEASENQENEEIISSQSIIKYALNFLSFEFRDEYGRLSRYERLDGSY